MRKYFAAIPKISGSHFINLKKSSAHGTPVISNLVSLNSSVDLLVCSGKKSTSYDVSSSVDIIITKQ